MIAAILAYLLITSTQITAGEMVPKLYAIDRAERVARLISRPLQWFRVLFNPFIISLTVASNAMLGVLGVDPERRIARGGSPDELKRLIRDSEAGGMLETNEATMLSGVFHLHEQEARQVMTPIPAVVTVDIAEDVQTALRRCIDSGHTRLPVTEDENQDRIRGVVHATGLARRLLDVGPESSIAPLVRDAPIVPETKPLDDLLAELQRQRLALAVVADEYGRVVGIVTIEDIVEEVVGEITDETDAGGRRRAPSAERRLVRPRARRRSPTSRTTGSCCPATTPTTRSAAWSSTTSAACPSAATRSTSTASSCGWSRCARTASCWFACASASRAPRSRSRAGSERGGVAAGALNDRRPGG